MNDLQVVSYRDEFYPTGFRKIVMMLVIAAVTVLPPLRTWQYEPVERRGASSLPSGRFAPGGGLLPEREPSGGGFLSSLWTGIQRIALVLITSMALVLYYPRRGFKRYAILCGPLIALLVPACIALYLRGRVEVYRVEIVLVTLVAALPGIALYAWLTWRKAKRLGMTW